MIGKGFVLERRLQLAVNIASYVRILFGTPFLDTSCGKDDFGVLTRPGQALGTSPVYLKKELFGQPVPVTTMSTANSPIILLMLGIVLLEVYLDRDSQAYQTGRQPSLQDLQAHLTTWCGQVSDKLPRRFQIAVRKCHLASFASSVFAEQIPQDLDEIVDHMSVLHSNELR
ncbi:uncharacterized protein RHO25_002263 [Cercospora beticola]|uniref:Protein kinase domain-containing protein n=1 Tax=Cercospora beticola TaxID=122368 RepID=A0ABZ0NDP7_CERBT|nr:hypothetical protein RHO25_002263 [Cercospora beticola]